MFFVYFSICGFTYAVDESRFFQPICVSNAMIVFKYFLCIDGGVASSEPIG